MPARDLHYTSIADIAQAISKKDVSPVELTRHLLERIAQMDSKLHSYFTVTADRALDEARAAEREIVAGRYRGPLHGVPLGIKDLCDTAGVRTTAGTRVMADRVPTHDATVVARLRSAGAVILGKLATTEGAYGEHHPDYPTPVNPWSAALWTGVSSSGSGVATAAGLCLGSLGSDTGGSIRFPSAMNGVVGIKPTYGRVPLRGVFRMATSLDHVGPLCRTVRDAAIVLAAIAGHDDEDATSSSLPVDDYVSAAGTSGAGLSGLRIGVLSEADTRDLDPDICLAVRKEAESLRAAGAEIATVSLPPESSELAGHWSITCGVEMLVAHEQYYPARASDYGPALGMFLEATRRLPASEYARAHHLRLRFNERLRQLFEKIDVLACPSVGVRVPAGISMLDPDALILMSKLLLTTAPFDYSGSPTISVPCGFAQGDMPLSLQLVGRHFEEATLIRAAAAYESATSWHLRHPNV